jgi:enoyl-CoA hydratase
MSRHHPQGSRYILFRRRRSWKFRRRSRAPAEPAEKPALLALREAVLAGPDMCKAWEEIEPVTIAAIEGYCVGGAAALVLCCDFRIAGEGAMMRLPEVPLGINMSWRTLPRLATIAGPSRAKRFTMFGEPQRQRLCLLGVW